MYCFRVVVGLEDRKPGDYCNHHLIGERVSVELFVVRVTGRPADSHAPVNIATFHPSPPATDAARQTGRV